MKNSLETDYNKNMTYQNLRDMSKEATRENYIALSIFIYI